MSHYGEDRYLDKEDQLYQVLSDYGEGALFSSEGLGCDSGAEDFLAKQYAKYNVPIPPKIEPILQYGPSLLVRYVDYMDPYALFNEYSDVVMTDDWCTYTYEIIDRGRTTEADPNFLDTFSWAPKQSEMFFSKHINKPGLNQLPQDLYIPVLSFHSDVMSGMFHEIMLYSQLKGEMICSCELMGDVVQYCTTVEGFFNKEWANAYFDLSIWASILWLFGPLSREFRTSSSPLLDVIITEGEAILYEGEIFGPDSYKKLERVPQSCFQCGVSGWCVDNILDGDGIVRLICEGCLNKGSPKYPGTTCGTRFCRYWSCHHNAFYCDSQSAQMAMRNYGQLSQKLNDGKGQLVGEARKLIV